MDKVILERLKTNQTPFCFLTGKEQEILLDPSVAVEALQATPHECWWPVYDRAAFRACHVLRVAK